MATNTIPGKTSVVAGAKAEAVAERYLIERGMKTCRRNYRCSLGEIDLIMKDAGTLVFVEVRQRSTASFGQPVETVTLAKRRKIVHAAQHYLMSHRISSSQALRFDVLGILTNKTDKNPEFNWIQNAFGEV